MSRVKVMLCLPLIALTILLSPACFAETEERGVTYENQSAMPLKVLLDGSALTTLEPSESEGFQRRKYLLPDHIQAYDESGRLRFDKTFTWQDLKNTKWRVTITADEPTPIQ